MVLCTQKRLLVHIDQRTWFLCPWRTWHKIIKMVQSSPKTHEAKAADIPDWAQWLYSTAKLQLPVLYSSAPAASPEHKGKRSVAEESARIVGLLLVLQAWVLGHLAMRTKASVFPKSESANIQEAGRNQVIQTCTDSCAWKRLVFGWLDRRHHETRNVPVSLDCVDLESRWAAAPKFVNTISSICSLSD